jgi:hypothetical protein
MERETKSTTSFAEFLNSIREMRISEGKASLIPKILPTYDFDELKKFRLEFYNDKLTTYQNERGLINENERKKFNILFWENEDIEIVKWLSEIKASVISRNIDLVQISLYADYVRNVLEDLKKETPEQPTTKKQGDGITVEAKCLLLWFLIKYENMYQDVNIVERETTKTNRAATFAEFRKFKDDFKFIVGTEKTFDKQLSILGRLERFKGGKTTKAYEKLINEIEPYLSNYPNALENLRTVV